MQADQSFETKFRIGNRQVGGDAPVFVIAEAGVAHFGRMDLAEQLVDLAAQGKADAFKLQVFDVDQLIASSAADWKDRLRPRKLSFEQVKQLRDRCRQAGMEFILTFHEPSLLSWVELLDVAAVKVGSGERNNPEFLQQLVKLGRPVIVSTGMSDLDDVREAVTALADAGCRQAGLLHCVTSYPTPPAEVNVRAMDRLAEVFSGPVGYSDHTVDNMAVYCAVARGAKIIEKHITVLRDVPNAQDWKVSCGPEDFTDFMQKIRLVEQLLGHGRKEPAPCEMGAMNWALKSIVAGRNLAAGHVLQREDLACKRPGNGLRPAEMGKLLGRRTKVAIEADTPVTFQMLE